MTHRVSKSYYANLALISAFALSGCGSDKIDLTIQSDTGFVYGSANTILWLQPNTNHLVEISATSNVENYDEGSLIIESDLDFSGSSANETRSATASLKINETLTIKATATGSVGSDSLTQSETFTVKPTMVYGSTSALPHQQNIAYALPDSSSTTPALIYIHGGGWDSQDFLDFEKEIDNAAQNDYAAFSINYRLSGEAAWPAQIDDVRCAIQHIVNRAQTFNIDPNRIGLVGYSAGAHLALLAAISNNSDTYSADYPSTLGTSCSEPALSYNIQAVSVYSAPTNLAAVVAVGPNRDAKSKVTNLLSMSGSDVQFMRDADVDITDSNWLDTLISSSNSAQQTTIDTLQRFSPVTYAENTQANQWNIPVLLQHGDNDPVAHVQNSIDFYCATNNATIKIHPNVTHNWGSFSSAAKTNRRENTLAFFDYHLTGTSSPIPSDTISCE